MSPPGSSAESTFLSAYGSNHYIGIGALLRASPFWSQPIGLNTFFCPSLRQRHIARKTARKRCKTRQCRVGAASIVAGAFASTDRQRAPNDSTRKRRARSPSGQRFASKPAFAIRLWTNARASATWRRDARQEERAACAGLKHEAIAVGLERVGEFGLACRRNWPRVGEDRDIEAQAGEFGLAERPKARISKARLDRIGNRILERAVGAARVNRRSRAAVRHGSA